MKNIVLDSNDIINKIRRISFEIIEKNIDENEISLMERFFLSMSIK